MKLLHRQGQDRISIITLFSVWLEVTITMSLLMAEFYIAVAIFTPLSFSITGLVSFTYSIWKRDKVNEQLGAYNWATGFVIDRLGRWRYYDYAFKDHEEIIVTDQMLSDFIASQDFEDALKRVATKQNIPEVEVQRGISRMLPPNDAVDHKLAEFYSEFGITTSTQIYCIEKLRITLEKSNKDKWEELCEKLKKMKEDVKPLGDVTSYLQKEMEKYVEDGGTSEKHMVQYRSRTVELRSVNEFYPKKGFEKEPRKKFAFGIALSILSPILAMSLSGDDIVEMYPGVVTLPLLAMVFGIAYNYLVGNNLIKSSVEKPVSLVFNNILSKKTEMDAFVFVMRDLDGKIPRPRLYRITTFEPPTASLKEFIAILPSSFNDSFNFTTGIIPFRGYHKRALTTPVVMQETYELFNGIRMFLFSGCSFLFQNAASFYYDFNVHKNWVADVMLYYIGMQQHRINSLNPGKVLAEVRMEGWKDFANTAFSDLDVDRRGKGGQQTVSDPGGIVGMYQHAQHGTVVEKVQVPPKEMYPIIYSLIAALIIAVIVAAIGWAV